MPTRPPELVELRLGEIERWGKNPRSITPEMLEKLAGSIRKYGLFQTLTVWREDGKIVAGGGNMRLLAMTEVLEWPPEKKIFCFMNYPESEAEKIELSFLDNQAFGFYDQLEVAELVKPVIDELDGELLKISFAEPTTIPELMARVNKAGMMKENEPNEKEFDEDMGLEHKCPFCGFEF